jgi:hypothetical protein
MTQEQVIFKFGGMMSPVGPHPTHEDTFGRGGFVAITADAAPGNINEFLGEKIPFLRRKVGMTVHVLFNDSSSAYYKCLNIGNATNDNGQWENTTFTLKSGDVMTGSLTAPSIHANFISGTNSNFTGSLTSSNIHGNFISGTNANFTGSLTASAIHSTGNLSGITVTGTNANFTDSLTSSNIHGNFISGTNANFTGSLTAGNIRSNGNLSGITVTGTNANFTGSLTAENIHGIFISGTNAIFTGSLTAGNIRSNGNLSGITITGTNATIGISGNSIASNIVQPFINVIKTGGTQASGSGLNPGTSNFLNVPRIVLGDYSSNLWGWPSAIDFEARLTSGGVNGIGFRIGPSWSYSNASQLTRSDIVFWGAPGKTAGGIGISGGLSGEGLDILGFFRYGSGLIDNGFHSNEKIFTKKGLYSQNSSGFSNKFFPPTGNEGLTQGSYFRIEHPGTAGGQTFSAQFVNTYGRNNFTLLSFAAGPTADMSGSERQLLVNKTGDNNCSTLTLLNTRGSWGWGNAINFDNLYYPPASTSTPYEDRIYDTSFRIHHRHTNSGSSQLWFSGAGAMAATSLNDPGSITWGVSGANYTHPLGVTGIAPRGTTYGLQGLAFLNFGSEWDGWNGFHVKHGVFASSFASAHRVKYDDYPLGATQGNPDVKWISNPDYKKTLIVRPSDDYSDRDLNINSTGVRFLSWNALGMIPPFNIVFTRWTGLGASPKTTPSLDRTRRYAFYNQLPNVQIERNPGLFIRYSNALTNNSSPIIIQNRQVRGVGILPIGFIGTATDNYTVPNGFCKNCPLIDLTSQINSPSDWILWEIDIIPLNTRGESLFKRTPSQYNLE